MIKTVKVKKKLRLDELIKHVWDNDLYPIICFKDGGGRASVILGNAGSIEFGEYSYGTFRKGDTFTVEVEEEITEDTVFDSLIEITADGGYIDHGYNISVSDVKGQHSIRFYTIINKKLELIWEAE